MNQQKEAERQIKLQLKSRNAQIKELARRWKQLKTKYDQACLQLYELNIARKPSTSLQLMSKAKSEVK